MVLDRARDLALTAAMVVLVVLASSAGCTPASDGATRTLPADRAAGAGAEPPPAPTVAPSAPAEAGAQTPADGGVLAALAVREVKGRAPRAGYSREAFGQAWADVDRNGCDTRNDVLRRDLVDLTLKPGTRDCVVLTGRLEDPYSGRSMPFERGARSAEVQVDHVVALSDAWQKGAQSWSPTKRETFANDPLNLLAVDGALNAQKGAGDAATWLPPSRPSWCAYAARQVAVKAAYAVWVTPAERDALQRILTGCPATGLPTEPDVTAAVEPSALPAPAAAAPTPTTASEQQTDARFPFCQDLPSGYGPYVAGDDAVSAAVLARLAALSSATVHRLAGEDRYATAAAVSAAHWSSGSGTVYLASGSSFPDALSGGPAAGLAGAPVLLTTRDCMPTATAAEVARLGASRLVVLGGEAAVGSSGLTTSC